MEPHRKNAVLLLVQDGIGECLLIGNGLNFHQSASGQILHGEGSPGRLGFGEELGVHLVHGTEVGNVR